MTKDKTTKKNDKTKVICAFTTCKHNKVKGTYYICSLDKISLAWLNGYMVCKMEDKE